MTSASRNNNMSVQEITNICAPASAFPPPDPTLFLLRKEAHCRNYLGSQEDVNGNMRMQTNVKVCTLNCWGLLLISKRREERITAIAERLALGEYDFVFLQEVWTTKDYEKIKRRVGDVLPYSHYFYSGVIGAGLCVFSRSPIKAVFFHRWAVNGHVHKIQHGDWFGGKGVGLAVVEHRGLTINLYTTHLHAEYDRKDDEYLCHRITQAFETAQFIQVTSQSADAVLMGGDLNTEPGDLAYRLLCQTAQLRDAFLEVNGSNTTLHQATCDSPTNSFTPKTAIQLCPLGKRLDYILYREGRNSAIQLNALSLEVPWEDRVPGENFSYSDHEAVVSTVQISKSNSSTSIRSLPSLNDDVRREALEEAVQVCEDNIEKLQFRKKVYWFVAFACFAFLISTIHLEFSTVATLVMAICRLLAILILCFAIFMSVIAHRTELHGILEGKLGMLVELGRPLEPYMDVVPDAAILGGDDDTIKPNNPIDCLP